MRPLIVLLPLVLVALAGCNGGGGGSGDGPAGGFELQVVDNLAGASLPLRGVFLLGADGWKQAIANGTALSFDGVGGNLSLPGEVPAASYTQLRILFGDLTVGGQPARMTETGLELELPMNVSADGHTVLTLGFAWGDALFKTDAGLAFAPALDAVVLVEDGTKRLDLRASQIQSATKVPVARMRLFDPTGLEVFQSTFVAESPEKPVVGNAGLLTLSGSPSAAVKKGATLQDYSWEVAGDGNTKLAGKGVTVRLQFPISGGNFTVRLTVTDSQGLQDTQTLKLALKPGTLTVPFDFTGVVSGVTAGTNTVGGEAGRHDFPVTPNAVNGSAAQLVRATATLGATSQAPVSEINLQLLDGAGKSVASTNSAGSQDHFDVQPAADAAEGDWALLVNPGRAYEASYTVHLELTWKGVNPGIEAFLAKYDDGHSHTH